MAVLTITNDNFQQEEMCIRDRTAKECLEGKLEEVSNFCPGLDIASILHEHLPVRLYMS